MSHSIGKQLAEARAARGLTVDDVAHATRIPAGRIRDLEEDEYAHFPNLFYGRGFLRLYSEYLGVDASEFVNELRHTTVDGGQDFKYFVAPDNTVELSGGLPYSRGSNRPLIAVAAVLLCLAVPAFLLAQKFMRGDDPATTSGSPETSTVSPEKPALMEGQPSIETQVPDSNPDLDNTPTKPGIAVAANTKAPPSPVDVPEKSAVPAKVEPEPKPEIAKPAINAEEPVIPKAQPVSAQTAESSPENESIVHPTLTPAVPSE